MDSHSRDVATAVQWIFTYCHVGGEVGGKHNLYVITATDD
jgi:hypothetical protein